MPTERSEVVPSKIAPKPGLDPTGIDAFTSFALSLSTICILAGGITSFHVGLCGVGGAGIGIGWPVGCLFALVVALTMGQLASAFPKAGGPYSLIRYASEKAISNNISAQGGDPALLNL